MTYQAPEDRLYTAIKEARNFYNYEDEPERQITPKTKEQLDMVFNGLDANNTQDRLYAFANYVIVDYLINHRAKYKYSKYNDQVLEMLLKETDND